MDMSSPAASDDRQLLVSSDSEGRTVLVLSGEIDLSRIEELSEQIDAAVNPADRLLFDLSGVTFMDSSGIALLLTTANSVAETVIRAPSRQVRRVLEATGLTSVLRIVP
jgi:anti-sigma B factor antagonist